MIRAIFPENRFFDFFPRYRSFFHEEALELSADKRQESDWISLTSQEKVNLSSKRESRRRKRTTYSVTVARHWLFLDSGGEEIDDGALIPRQGPEIRFVRVSDGQDLFEFCHEFPRSFFQRTRKGQHSPSLCRNWTRDLFEGKSC